MMIKAEYLEYTIYWLIVLLPFSVAIAPAFMNAFMGILTVSFLYKKILKKESLFIETTVNLPLFLFFIITCLSLTNSIDLRDSLKGGVLRLLQYIFILFIIAEELRDKTHLKRVILSMALGIFLVSLDAIFQVISGYDFIRQYEPAVILGFKRATASFKDPNTLGVYLTAIAPLVFGLTLFYFKKIKRMVFVFAILIISLGILLTYSRPALLAIYVALFFFGIIKKRKSLVIILVIFILLAPFIVPRQVKEWAKQVDYHPVRFLCNDDKIAIYIHSLNMIKAHPIIGLGANTYMKNYKSYKNIPEYRNVVTSDYLYAHNNFLHMAAEIGLVGLGIFLWFLCVLFRRCIFIYRRLQEYFSKMTMLSVIGCVIAFLVNGLTESSLYSSRVAIIFWYLVGLCLSFEKFLKTQDERA